jgi:nucleoside phosphorylase
MYIHEESRDRLFACALRLEYCAARKLGEAVLVGIRCRKEMPKRPVVSFGFAGALRFGLFPGAVVVATKVVNEEGRLLGVCQPLSVPNAIEVVVLGANRFIESKKERARLCKSSGADVVDMETGLYARADILEHYLRVISDTPEHPISALNFFTTIQNGSRALQTLRSLRL